uniref:Uncharacterized protein n=1 Tax=Tanacetum cinerariifolium TaxID=118510 RepID=A0A699GKV2_TANCI|nr:hypothetical protein [Tanacetum cinerariifolium]
MISRCATIAPIIYEGFFFNPGLFFGFILIVLDMLSIRLTRVGEGWPFSGGKDATVQGCCPITPNFGSTLLAPSSGDYESVMFFPFSSDSSRLGCQVPWMAPNVELNLRRLLVLGKSDLIDDKCQIQLDSSRAWSFGRLYLITRVLYLGITFGVERAEFDKAVVAFPSTNFPFQSKVAAAVESALSEVVNIQPDKIVHSATPASVPASTLYANESLKRTSTPEEPEHAPDVSFSLFYFYVINILVIVVKLSCSELLMVNPLVLILFHLLFSPRLPYHRDFSSFLKEVQVQSEFHIIFFVSLLSCPPHWPITRSVAVEDDLPSYGYDRNDVQRLCARLICLCEMREEVLVSSGLSSMWFKKECDPVFRRIDDNAYRFRGYNLCSLFVVPFERVSSHTTALALKGAIISLPTRDEIAASLPDSHLVKKSKGPSQASRPSKRMKLQKRASEAGSSASELDQADGADEADLADLYAEIEDSLERDEDVSMRAVSAPTSCLGKRLGVPPSIVVTSVSDPSHVGTSAPVSTSGRSLSL